DVLLLLQKMLAVLERERGGTEIAAKLAAMERPPSRPTRRPARPEIAALVDMEDEVWLRQSIDELKRWALRGRELDEDMRTAASMSARGRALAALERHDAEYRAIKSRHDDIEQRRAQIKVDREIATGGWEPWLRRVTAERDARRK